VIGGWRAWQRMVPVWVPAVLLCLVSVAVYIWLSSGFGREAQLRQGVIELETRLVELEGLAASAAAEREAVAALEGELGHLYDDVFGSLEARLTDILRTVGNATREAGLLPSAYAYNAEKEERLDLIRFGIQFAVTGEYAQVRQLLAVLQESPEFIIVEALSLTGEEGVATRELRIQLKLATYVAHAGRDTLRELTGEASVGGGGNG
jgi:hypothetical protein